MQAPSLLMSTGELQRAVAAMCVHYWPPGDIGCPHFPVFPFLSISCSPLPLLPHICHELCLLLTIHVKQSIATIRTM